MLVSAASVGCGFFLVAIPFAGVLAAWFSGNIGQPDGQSEDFVEFAMDLARKADNARRQFEED
jgi:hypothetical protein